MKYLSNLRSLDLSGNQIQDYSFFKYLPDLKELTFQNEGLQDISFLKPLTNLQLLNLGYCLQIEDISVLKYLLKLRWLYLHFNKIRDISCLKSLSNLEYILIECNNIQDISAFRYLSNLKYLGVMGNKIQDVSALKELSNLEELGLAGNKIRDIFHLKDLSNLVKLTLGENQIENINLSFFQKLSKLEVLELSPNSLFKIPKEIIGNYSDNCLNSLLNYLKDLEKGKSPNNEVKIVLIGNGSVGKTQIVKRLQWMEEGNFCIDEVHHSTHAISLKRQNLECELLSSGLELNIWDFGGQDIYHATHRLFLQTRALFILVWDAKNEIPNSQHEYNGVKYDNYPLRYWLEYAKYFGKNSPILVVQNKVDIYDFRLDKMTKNALKADFPIIDFLEISAKTGKGLGVLKDTLVEIFEENEDLKNDLINKQLPTAWIRMRNRVRAEQEKENGLKQIEKSIFQAWCEAELIPDSAPTLLDFFHQTGVLFYDEKYFDGQIILDQEWVITAVYKVLDKDKPYYDTLKHKQGKLRYREISRIWKEHTDEERTLFLNFMLSCDLCFESTQYIESFMPLKDKIFVVPQLLEDVTPDYIENYVKMYEMRGRYTKKYTFLPTSLIQCFIIKAHHWADTETDIWQKGIFLKYDNAYALVEAKYGLEPQIFIRYNEAASQTLLQAITEELEKLENEGVVKVSHLKEGVDVQRFGLERLIAFKFPYKSLKMEVDLFIKDGNIKAAIEKLLIYTEKNRLSYHNDLLLLSARFRKNEGKQLKGTISESDYQLEWNKISAALIILLEEINADSAHE